MIKFYDEKHEAAYYTLLNQMRKVDCYHLSLAYLFTLDTACREHISDLFDIKDDIILFNGLTKGWQTGTSVKTTRLAFNLWSSYVDECPERSTPSEIFCSVYAPYYFEAIKLRFPDADYD